MNFRIAGRKLDRSTVFIDRRVCLTFALQRRTQAVMRFTIVWIQPNRFVQCRGRLVEFGLLQINIAQREMCVGELRLQVHALLQSRNRTDKIVFAF